MKSKSVRAIAKFLVAAALLAVGGWGGYYVWKRYLHPAPLAAIERLIESGARAAEAESVIRLSSVFSREYRDASGFDRSAVLGHAQRFFAESDNLEVKIASVLHEDPNLDSTAEQARAIVALTVKGTTGEQRFQGIGGQGVDVFALTLRKESGDWKVVGTRRLQGTDPAEWLRDLTEDR